MAGRPRTMLKRIGEWKQEADRLEQQVRHAMPKAYFDYHVFVDIEKYQDSLGLVDLNAIPDLDRVAFEWSLVEEAASGLVDHLHGLELAIRERLERKAVRLCAPITETQPGSTTRDDGDDSEEMQVQRHPGEGPES